MRIFKIFLLGIFVCTALGLRGQELEWAKTFTENSVFPGSNFNMTDMTLDFNDNVYVGSTIQDFAWSIKMDSTGKRQFRRGVPSLGDSKVTSISVDINGEMFIACQFEDSILLPDFSYLVSKGFGDIFVSKLDSTGQSIWIKSFGGIWDEKVSSTAVDEYGNLYITGSFTGTADFNPGPGVFNLTSSGFDDCYILKLDAFGNFLWAKSLSGSGFENSNSIHVDKYGNIYTAGDFVGTVDFDPGPGITNLTSTTSSYDVFISKLDSSGNFIWAKTFGGSSSNRMYSIAVDSNCNVYTCGSFQGIIDFDPGIGSFIDTSFGNKDAYISKLDSSGNFIWAKSFGGPDLDQANSLTIDEEGNVYVTGQFGGTVDFDPGPGIVNYSSLGSQDIFVLKIGSLGDFKWAMTLGGNLGDEGIGIEVNNSDNLYVSGNFFDTVDFDPGSNDSIYIAGNLKHGFLLKFIQCPNPDIPTLSSSDSICSGDSTWLILDGNLNDATDWHWYTGSCGGTLFGTGDSILVAGTSNQTFYVRGEGGCVTPGTCAQFDIVVGNSGGGVSASVNDTLVCLGDPLTFTASGGTNYQWSGGITNGQTFTTTSPGILLSYVTGEDAFGCTSEDSVYSFVSESYSLADKGKFIGSGFESYVPLYFYCDAAETDSALYNFNSHWISFIDIFSFIFAPFGSGCPSTTSINQSSDAYEGLNALRMDADTNGFAQASISGILAGRPNKLQGYFKTNAGPNDTIAVVIGAVETGLAADAQDSANYVGYGEFVSTGSTGTYTQFEVPINYSGSAPTDSFEISLVFVNSALTGGVKSLWFDAFNLVYDTTVLSICSGDSAFLGGAWQTTAGLYTDNLLTEFGCDSVVLTELELLPAAIVNAGTDQAFCEDVNTISLNGSFSNAVSATWSGGAGTFSPNANDPNAVYTPTTAEKSSGSLSLVLTTSGAGTCSVRSDTVNFSFDPLPGVNAGPDQTVCADITNVSLNGSVTNATGGIWSGSGTGTFSPSNTSLNASYSLSAADISNGFVDLILTSTGNGNCSSQSDTLRISIDPVPIANAGSDQTFCEDIGSFTLNGTFSNAVGISWSGGAGTFTPDANTANASYSPSTAELSAGTVTLTLTTNGSGACSPASDNVTFTFDPLPSVNAGADQAICESATSVSLSGIVTGASGGQWSSSGTGLFNPSNTNLNASYAPSASDISSGFVDLILTSTGNGTCSAVSDTLRISIDPLPTANAGADQSFCADIGSIILNGSSTNATGIIWTGGTGTFSPNANTANASYTPSATELSTGSVTLSLSTTGNGACSPASDNVTFTFDPIPIVNAGADISVCEDQSSVSLNGSFSGSTGVLWSSTGTGSFSPSNTDPLASYAPSTIDISNGSVDLILTSTGNGLCSASSDTMTISFDPLPGVNAGADQSVCSNNATVNLSGAVTNASGGIWSGGSGTFTPSATDLNATYSPSASEITAGSVTLILTSTGNGNCNAVSDTMQITITPGPTANAGADQSVCANNPIVTLSGTVTIASGGIWSGGTGTFAPSASDLNASYTPSAAEITAGSLSLILSSTGNGTCLPATDTVLISITPAPTVDAGADTSICENNPSINLNGSVTVASGGLWSGGSGIFNPNPTALNATYTAGAADLAAGSVVLSLTSTSNGNCLSVSDDIVITFDPAPTVNAGADQSVCSDIAAIPLNGTVSNASGGVWNSIGTGTFTPNATTLNASYIPSAQDLLNGLVNITLTSTGSGQCASVFDQVNITFNTAPVVDLGQDSILCSDLNETITLDAGSGFASYLWSDGSTNQTLLVDNAFFQANGSTIWAEVTDNNTCRGSDTVDISFTICVGLTGTGQNLIRNIYPNPTTGKVIIEMEESNKTQISILDQKGSTLRSFEMNGNQIEMDLEDLPSAKYFIQIQGEGIDLLKGIIKN